MDNKDTQSMHRSAMTDSSNTQTTTTRRGSLLRMASWAAACGTWPLAGAAQSVRTSQADGWPTQPVDVMVPYPAGGVVSRLGLALAKNIGARSAHPITPHYVPGKAGAVAGALVAKARPDGSQFLLAGSHMAIGSALQVDKGFDFLSQLQPLMLLVQMPMVVVINPGRLRARTASELVLELARKPARYRISCGGDASTSRMGAEMLRYHAKSQLEVVNFRGSGPGLQALVAGHTDVMVEALVSCLPEIRKGRMRPLMVLSSVRNPSLPHVETSAEIGLPLLQMDAWSGMFGPRGMSRKLQASVQDRLGALAQDAHFVSDWGIAWSGLHGGALESFMHERVALWKGRVQSLGLPVASAPTEGSS